MFTSLKDIIVNLWVIHCGSLQESCNTTYPGLDFKIYLIKNFNFEHCFEEIKDMNFNVFYPSVRLTLDLPIKTKNLDSIDIHIRNNIPLEFAIDDKNRF